MKRLILYPNGWECSLLDCPSGHFVFEEQLCFKSDYCTNEQAIAGKVDAYNSSGEFFTGKATDVTVQPVFAEWEEE